MKKVINYKVYNTETATKIGTSRKKETLYRKKTGEFFLYIHDKSTKHHRASDTGAITPLTYAEAKLWAEHYLQSAKYEEIFGEIESDATLVNLFVRIKSSTSKQAKRTAARKNISISQYIEELITQDITKKETN